jgi:hypothetical protein
MDQNFTEISHDHRTPNTDEVQRMIELAFLQHEHANLSRDRRIAALEAENADFRRKLGMYAMLECGQIPQVSDLTKIGCQIWHSPHLTAVQRRSKSVWSQRLTVSILHHRVMEEINVRLFPFQQFYKTASPPKNRTMHSCRYVMHFRRANGQGKRGAASFRHSLTEAVAPMSGTIRSPSFRIMSSIRPPQRHKPVFI